MNKPLRRFREYSALEPGRIIALPDDHHRRCYTVVTEPEAAE